MRYHKYVGFPNSIIFPEKIIHLTYFTDHAKEKIGTIKKFPTAIMVSLDTVIEIETKDDVTIKKAVIRQPYTSKKDIIIALKIRKDRKQATVISFWLNNDDDQHETLNKSKYDIPKEHHSRSLEEILQEELVFPSFVTDYLKKETYTTNILK